MEDKYKALTAIVGMLCLTIIEVYALMNGINSILTASIVGAIGTIIGAVLGVVIATKKTTST